MKRIYAFALFLSMLLGLGFNAGAASVTINWNIPGAWDKAQVGWILRWEYPAIPADALSQTFSFDYTVAEVTLYTKSAYVITDVTVANGGKLGSQKQQTTIDMVKYDGQTINITLAEKPREDEFTINIINGAASLTADFNSGYTLNLQNGSHKYKFDSSFDGRLKITLTDPEISNAYSITLNGEDLGEAEPNWHYYSIENLAPNDVIEIQVYESAEEEKKACTLTFDYGEGMEAALSSVFDASSSNSFIPGHFEGGVIRTLENITEGSTVKLFFLNPDVTVTKVIVNGVDRTSGIKTLSDTEQELDITISDDTTIRIEGVEKVWPDVTFNGYISIPEAVEFSQEMSGPFNIEPVITGNASGMSVTGGITMPEGSKSTNVTVSSKYNKVFFRPKEGYFIKGVYTWDADGRKYDLNGGASTIVATTGTTFYMIVEKMEEPYTFDLKVTGSANTLKFYPNPTVSANGATMAIASSWNNPERPGYSYEPGEREVSFVPNYDFPLEISTQATNLHVYLDGAEVNGATDENDVTRFTIRPYFPAAGETSDIKSVVNIYNQSAAPAMSGASVEFKNGAKADFFYSPVMHMASISGQSVLSGTLMTVKVTTLGAIVVYQGETQTLDEKGQFQFFATGNARNNVVTVIGGYDFDISLVEEEGKEETLADLETVFISFPNVMEAEVADENGAILRNTDTDDTWNGRIEIINNNTRATGVSVKVTFDDFPTEKGNYEFTLAPGAVTLDGISSPSVKKAYNFTVTGIDSISSKGEESFTVISIDGKVILKNAKAAQLRELQKGLYIINGKKAIVK